jgi:opacity protein-like surface antigen
MKVRIYFVLLAVVLAAPGVSSAKVLFGQNYTMLSYLYYNYRDSDKCYLDDGQGGSLLVNLNQDSSQDFQFGLDYVDSDGERYSRDIDISTLSFRADLVHTFCDSERVKPYFNIGLRVLDMDVTGPADEKADTDVGLGIGIGIEFELNDMLMAKISAEHDNVGDDDNYITAMLGCWFTDQIMGTIGIGRETDGDSTYAQAGVVFAF